MRNSVEQQSHLVAVGREQMMAQMEANANERRRYEKTMNANIFFIPKECVSSAGWNSHKFVMTNIGSDAIDVQLFVKLPGQNVHATSAILKRDQIEQVVFEYESVDEDHHAIMHCFYQAHDGRRIGFDLNAFISAETSNLTITPVVKAKDL